MQEGFLAICRLRARISLQLICLVLAAVLLGYYVYAGLCLGNAEDRVSNRMQFHAIPVALSYLYYGKPHDLTAYKGIAFEFQAQQTPLPQLLAKYSSGVDQANIQQQQTYYWVADDRGMGDFTIVAFRLFGPHISSLYWLYIALLAVSIGAYVLTLYRDRLSMTVMVVLLGGYVVSLFAAVVSGSNDNYNFEGKLIPIHDSRTFDALAIIGLAHILLAALSRRRLGVVGLFGLMTQVAVLCLILMARSSLKLEILVLLCVMLVLIAYCTLSRHRRIRSEGASQDTSLPPLRSLVIGLVCLLSVPVLAHIYESRIYNAAYNNTVRTVWHNILMGVGVPEPGAVFPSSESDDALVIKAVVAHRNLRHPESPWDEQTILNSLGGHVEFDWRAYEAEARDIFFGLWRQEPGVMAAWYLYGKPLLVAKLLKKAVSDDVDLTSKDYSRFCPETCEAEVTFIHWPVLAVLLILALAARDVVLRYWTPVFVVLFAAALVYLIPSIVFYEFILNLLGTITLGAAMFYWIVAGFIAKMANRWIPPVRDPQPVSIITQS